MLSKSRSRLVPLDKKVGSLFSFMSPNAWTAFSLVFGFATLLFVLRAQFALAAFFLALAALCDAIDGAVARIRGASRSGAYVDTIADRYVEFFSLAGLFVIPLPAFGLSAAAWAAIYLFGSLLTTYAKAAAFEKGLVKKELRGGVIERQERMVLLIAGFVAASLQPIYLVYVLALLALLANVTAFQRIHAALRGNAYV